MNHCVHRNWTAQMNWAKYLQTYKNRKMGKGHSETVYREKQIPMAQNM